MCYSERLGVTVCLQRKVHFLSVNLSLRFAALELQSLKHELEVSLQSMF
jgi:hypothetical protein